jgi:hypothetical protein
MKKKIYLGTFFVLSLLLLTVFISVSPTLAHRHTTDVVFTGALGEVTLQLPSNSSPPVSPGGIPNHPTILKLVAFDYDRGSTFGAADELDVFLWQPIANTFQPVAVITDNPNNAEFWKATWNGTYVWLQAILPPPIGQTTLFPNVILVQPGDLQVWIESEHSRDRNDASNTFWVNLTTTVKVTLPYFNATGVNSNQTFNMPPTTLMYKTTSDEFVLPWTTSFTGYKNSSNYTWVREGAEQFAAVRIHIPAWLAGAGPRDWTLDTTGSVRWNEVDTLTPP